MNTKNLVFVALFSSIMGVLGLIPPIALAITPVPITLQSLGVMLAGGLLGSSRCIKSAYFLTYSWSWSTITCWWARGSRCICWAKCRIFTWFIVGAFVIGYLIERLREVSIIKSTMH